jgi:hypothetical protein
MPVKNFKFVSPGVFINEIDNSFRPRRADAIGPVVIGRSTRGLAMQPVTVQSYSDFVTQFGGTVAGGGGGDIYRDGNYQSPMYGTYAAKAFLNANVAPLTFIRLLGQQRSDNDGSTDGQAGWQTVNSTPSTALASNGGAYGLWIFKSASVGTDLGEGMLSAVWYLDSGKIRLTGSNYAITGTAAAIATETTGAINTLISTDSNNLFTVEVFSTDSATSPTETIKFNFDDSKETFIRKRFNTNPQLMAAGDFYPLASEKTYWLGETFEQELRDSSFTTAYNTDLTSGTPLVGLIAPMKEPSSTATPAAMKGKASEEARAGWFVGQHQGAPASYLATGLQKLFRFIGRGHGEWLHKNTKVSIEKIRQSNSSTTDYGTFSVVVRSLRDTDNNVQVLERFDNLTLDPASPNYVARRIGDRYYAWNESERRLREYGDYPNQSRYFRVEMNEDADAGATDPVLLPFGYYGPPKFSDTGTLTHASTGYGTAFITASGGPDFAANLVFGAQSGSNGTIRPLSGKFVFPSVRLRTSASDGGLSNPADAYFGFMSTRTDSSTRADASISDPHRLWTTTWPSDPTTSVAGVDSFAYVFTLDDLEKDASGNYSYKSGSRQAGTSVSSASYTDVLDDGYGQFTAPFYGGFDGFDITKPDPLYNTGMPTATSTELNNYAFHTYRRAIDTVADAEFVDMNLLTVPGLTVESLTTHMINVCEDRADSLALIDLPDIYRPAHEKYYADRKDRIGTTPTQAATAVRDRRIDSSYGATFYPWVQTRDETSGQLVWVPPTVAMMGVLASSERASQVWFAPAGFNRGGLSDGAAGIPIVNVTERLTSKQRDTLYESRINPIASFPSTGIVVFGQKTLQERPSALDRINVRRLVIFLKKQISILSTQILFEQNVQATWNRFKGLVEPFLANVKTQFGISDYRLILDETTTTPDLVDQNILYAKIMVKPARAIEYIAIDFVVASTGASFDD